MGVWKKQKTKTRSQVWAKLWVIFLLIGARLKVVRETMQQAMMPLGGDGTYPAPV